MVKEAYSLGRMTNLFDGCSIIVEKNHGLVEEASAVSKEEVKRLVAEAMKDFASILVSRGVIDMSNDNVKNHYR